MSDEVMVWYDSPEALWNAFSTGLSEAAGEEDGGGIAGFVTADGEEIEMSDEEVIANLTDSGMWAYCDTVGGKIHAWVSATTLLPDTVLLLAHELAHLCGLDAPPADHGITEEDWADRVGHVAAQAYVLAAARHAVLLAGHWNKVGHIQPPRLRLELPETP